MYSRESIGSIIVLELLSAVIVLAYRELIDKQRYGK